jgi:hypothetical protein
MSDFYQPGQHPDADQLSAFAEDALPAHEREQTLAHLGGCAHCRTIVSLTLPPMEDTPQLQAAAARRPWFYGWNVAWLAGAGLAALIFLTVHIRNSGREGRIASTTTQTAEVRMAAPPQADHLKPRATDATPIPVRKTVPEMAAPRAADSVEALKNPPASATMSSQQIANLPVAGRRFIAQPQQQPTQRQQAGALHGSVSGAATGAGAGGVIAHDDRSALAQRGAANQSDKRATTSSAATPAPAAAAPVMSAEVQPAPAPPAAAAKAAPQSSDSVMVAAASPQVETTNASVSTTLASLSVIDARRLPSHLAIASTITRAKQMLALDTAGALFLSTDGGRHWKAVAAQWQGRAVKIGLASLPMLSVKQPMRAYVDGNASASGLAGLDGKAISVSSVGGVVTDSAGAIVPNVLIDVTDSRTSIVRATVSDRNGHYAVGGLAPGTYQIDASAAGFEPWRGAVTVAGAQQSVVNISLRVGAANESVEVSSEDTITMDKVAKKARRDASEPSAAFEITTDSGEIWTSTDGRNWKRK